MQIRAIEYSLPSKKLSNDDLAAENPSWDMSTVEQRSGVSARHVAAEGQTALDLSAQACMSLIEKNPDCIESIDALICCTQSPDHVMPPNACILHKQLGLGESVLAFDFNLGCSGYVYGLAIARGLMAAGTARGILFVTADTYSKYVNRQDRSARVLFGDGAAVSWLCDGGDQTGLLDIQCATAGAYYDKFIIPAGACRAPSSSETTAGRVDRSGNIRTAENIHMDGMAILGFVNTRVPRQIRGLLGRNNLTTDDIDLFVFHQASKVALESIGRILKIDPERLYTNIRDIGNTVSASIPIAIKDAREAGVLKPGDLVMLSGFGLGLSWASALVRF